MTDKEKIDVLINCCENLLHASRNIISHDWEVFCRLGIGNYSLSMVTAQQLLDSVEHRLDDIKGEKK